jgi:hypothetical protein
LNFFLFSAILPTLNKTGYQETLFPVRFKVRLIAARHWGYQETLFPVRFKARLIAARYWGYQETLFPVRFKARQLPHDIGVKNHDRHTL